MTYRACTIKRDRRTRADIEVIKACICAVVKEQRPMTVRQVFYQLVVRGVVEKTEQQYNGTVIRLLTEMRLNGDLPFSWIIDESRRRRDTRTFDGVEDALADTARFYRRSALREAGEYLEVWVEKEALSGIIWEVASDYDVTVVVSKGMPSLSLLYSSACCIRAAAEAGKDSFIYQFGDHDPSGVLIPQVIQSRLTELCQKFDCPPPSVERVSLTAAQVVAYNLPTRPTKRDGNTHARDFAGDSVELDALPPDALRAMVHRVINQHISQRDLEILRTAEQSERDVISELAGVPS